MCVSTTTTTTTTKVCTNSKKDPMILQRESMVPSFVVKEAKMSGFEKRRRWIEMGVLFFSVCYGFIYWWNPRIPVRQELCHGHAHGDHEECFRPDLIAYKITTLIAMSIMGIMGAVHWHDCPTLHSHDCTTPMDRLYRPLLAADLHMVVAFCFQLWDFVVSWTIPENMDAIFLVHHVLAMITAYCSLEYQMLGYYAIFYGGCSEISSIFLVLMDTKHQVFDSVISLFLSPSNTEKFLLVCKAMFFVTFTYYRIVGWIYYSIPLWKDCRLVMNSSKAKAETTTLPNQHYFVLRIFLAMNLTLGCLQCYWYSIILRAIFSQA